MASYPQAYDEERFETAINRNFLCLICFNVLRNPVLCPRNQHHFCRACVTKFLETSQRCPTCSDELTVETLTEPPRFVKDYLNELSIHCKYVNRGCREIVQLQHLEHHEATCGFTPVICTNQGCGVSVNKRDQIHHESELCEFRKLKCHSCGEMTKMLADMEKRMAKMEKKVEKVESMETKMTNMETNIRSDIAKMKTDMEGKFQATMTEVSKDSERNMAVMKKDMEGKLEAVNIEVKGLKTALIEGFNELKEVLVKVEDMKEENTRKIRPGASGDIENIIVVGGASTNSVEIFNWRQKFWSPLQSLPENRSEMSSFVYNNHLTIAGGFCPRIGIVDNMIRLNIDPKPDISTHWSYCPFKLPAKLRNHTNVVYEDELIVTGGDDGNLGEASDCIKKVQLVPPCTVKTLSKMPEPRVFHSTEIFDDHLLIVGGRISLFSYDKLFSSVLLYDIKKNEYKQLAPLPYEVSDMATVKWRDNICVIGGIDKEGNRLDTFIIYIVKTEQHYMLPSMKCKRQNCCAVVIGDNIVVLGGMDEQGRYLKSVEAFNFDRNTWEELPEMSEGRWCSTAVAV